MSSVSITPVKRLTSVRRHPIAASPLNFRCQQQEKKPLAPRVGSGLRQIELNGTVLCGRTIASFIGNFKYARTERA